MGRPLTFTIKDTNNGTLNAGTDITDNLPSGVRFVRAKSSGGILPTRCTRSARTVTCGTFNLRSGQTATVKIVVIPTKPGTVTNTATDSFGNKAQATVRVNRAPAGHHHRRGGGARARSGSSRAGIFQS